MTTPEGPYFVRTLQTISSIIGPDGVRYHPLYGSAEPIAAHLNAQHAEIERLRELFDKARKLVLDAVAHGMPIDDDVITVRNGLAQEASD